ncbi:uracil-DNA glycosylase [bacterium]|nr:uracil-DNA glycosylase [bacterium]
MNKTSLIDELKKECEVCQDCELGKTRTNIVFSSGDENTAKAILIGEAPGANEDLTGTPFVGKAGKFLDKLLEEVGISREKDLYIINTVKCRPPKNRVPAKAEKDACRNFLIRQIEIINPKLLIFCGNTALKSFVSNKGSFSSVRGNLLEVILNEKAYKGIAIYHPSYLMQYATKEQIEMTKDDLSQIKSIIEE